MNAIEATVCAFAFIFTGLIWAFLLRAAWRGRDARRPWLIAALPMGAARGPAVALSLLPLAALAVVGAGVQVRNARSRAPREAALEPSERASRAWRGWLRALLAGPIGGVSAMGVALAWTVWAPGAPQTRMVVGGLLVPVLWGGAMAWTLADDKILRATAVLVGVTVVTFTASMLRGFA